MREKGLGWILKELSEDRQAKTRTDTMDLMRQTVPTTVGLKSTFFSQDGHLISNKKGKHPKGSLKRSREDYDPIDVSAPKRNLCSRRPGPHRRAPSLRSRGTLSTKKLEPNSKRALSHHLRCR